MIMTSFCNPRDAYPVIDVLIGVPILVEVERRIPALEAAGYEYVPECEQQLPDRRDFD